MLKDAEVVVTAWETGELTDLLDLATATVADGDSLGGSVKDVIGMQNYERGVRVSSQRSSSMPNPLLNAL